MEIETSRFGVLSIDDQRIMNFPKGLLGFPGKTRFALIKAGRTIILLDAVLDDPTLRSW